MAPSPFLLTCLVLLLALTLPAVAAPKPTSTKSSSSTGLHCPTLHTGTTTLKVAKPTKMTTTYYSATTYRPVYVDCRGFSQLTAETIPGVSATRTASQMGTVTSASYQCIPTNIPAACPTKYA